MAHNRLLDIHTHNKHTSLHRGLRVVHMQEYCRLPLALRTPALFAPRHSTHTHTHTHARARAYAHTRTQISTTGGCASYTCKVTVVSPSPSAHRPSLRRATSDRGLPLLGATSPAITRMTSSEAVVVAMETVTLVDYSPFSDVHEDGGVREKRQAAYGFVSVDLGAGRRPRCVCVHVCVFG